MTDMIFAKPGTKPKTAVVADGGDLGSGKDGGKVAAQPKIADRGGIIPSDAVLIEMIELFFFAYRDFVSDADAILDEFSFGRAHHRVLYFVNRSPGMTVAELLDILKITKQSLGRVLRDLVEADFIAQRTGEADRRQRLLYPTPKGKALAERLTEPQMRRISAALSALEPAGADLTSRFLRLMINEDDRQTPIGPGAKR